MVARGRPMALWFVTMLLLSVVTITAPPVAASSHFSIGTATAVDATSTSLPENTVIAAPSNLKIKFQVTATDCVPSEGSSPIGEGAPTIDVTVEAQGIIRNGANTPFRLQREPGTDNYAGILDLSVDQSVNPGIEGPHALRYTIDKDCPASPSLNTVGGATEAGNLQSLVFDTKGPAIAFSAQSNTISPAHQIDLGNGVLGPHSTIRFTATPTDARAVTSLTVDATGIGNNTAINITSTGLAEIRVPPSSGTLIDQQVQLKVRATDDFGNVNEVSYPVTIDNTPPVALQSPSVKVTRGPGSTATADFSWTSSGDETNRALVQLNGATVMENGAPKVLELTGTPAKATLSLTGVSTTADLDFALIPIDNAGNLPTSQIVQATEYARLGNVSFGFEAGIPAILVSDGFGWLNFTIDESVPASNINDNVFVTLEREGSGFLVTGQDGADDTDYKTSPTATEKNHKGALLQADGKTIVFPTFSVDGTPLNLKADTYTLGINVLSGTGASSLLHQIEFRVDGADPVIASNAIYGLALSGLTKQHHGADGNPVQVGLDVKEEADGDTGLRNVTIELVDKASGEVPRMAGEAFARRDLRPADCQGDPPAIPGCNDDHLAVESRLVFTETLLSGSYNTSFPGVPPGEYAVRVLATDNAGREESHVFDATEDTYRVGPRLAINTSGGFPFADATRIFVNAFGAYDLPISVPRADARCSGTVCQVPSVQAYARNVLADGFGEEKLLGEVFSSQALPMEAQTLTLFDGTASTPLFYNYTPGEGYFGYPMGLVSTQPIQVQLRASASVNGTAVSSATSWITANTASTPSIGALVMGSATPWRFNTTGSVDYSVSLDLKKAGGSPSLEYTLTRVVPATATAPLSRTVHGPFSAVAADTPEGSTTSWFNGTLSLDGAGAPLLEGEYTVVFQGFDGSQPRGSVTRLFAVATTAPTIHLEAQDVTGNISLRAGTTSQFNVKPQFNLSLRIEHGLLNLTSASAFTYDLSRAIPRDSAGPLLPNGSGGFRVNVRDVSPMEPGRTRTFVNLTVTLPGTASDGDLFDLRVNATTDGKISDEDPADPSRYKASTLVALRLDKSPPAVGVYDALTNGTGDSSQLKVVGFAQDVGSGIDRIEVRIYDVTRNRTVLWANPHAPSFAAGLVETSDAFASTDLIVLSANVSQHVRNVVGLTPGATTVEWSINQWERPILRSDGTATGERYRPLSLELDNASVYLVSVRARDRLGQVTDQLASRTVRFDTQPPLIAETPTPSGIRLVSAKPGEAGWHGIPDDARFFVNVTDNKCVKRVLLRGLDPAGQPLAPVEMRPVNASQASCSDYPHSAGMEWTTSLRESPALSDLVGTYRYYVEAEDASGRNATGPTTASQLFQLKIVDTLPPVVRFVNLDPPVVGEDLSSTIRAEVFENHGIDTVEVLVGEIGVGNSVTPLARGTMQASGTAAANGTALYVAETGRDLGLSLKRGDYLVQVRANDTAKACGSPVPCVLVNAILVVSDGLPPAISQVGGKPSFVNATPRLTYNVVDKHVQASGVQVRSGNSTENLTVVTPVIEPLLTGAGGARTGVRVTYAPGNLSTDEPLLVEIRAASNLTNTTTFTYQVDATPPVANHTVTGAQPIGDKDWVVSATRVALAASDGDGSGVARLAYWVNDPARTGAGTTYTGPIRPTGTRGTWTLDYEATDNASNLARGRVVLNLDGEGPSITVSRHGDSPSIIVTDGTGVGLDDGNVTVHYAYNGTSAFVNKKMERLAGTANAFSVELPGNATTQGLRYWFEARDRLGNAGSLFNASAPHVIGKDGPVVENGVPTVRILAPEAGETVRGPVELEWTSLDPENQPLKVSIGLQTPDNPAGVFLVRDGDDNKSWVLDTAGFRAGTYTFTLVATDGEATSQVATRSFVVLAGEVVTRIKLPPPNVEPQTEATFAVDVQPVGKTLKTATFAVTRDGQPFTNGVLRLDQGYYVGAVTPTEPGDYRIAVVVTYEDGSSDQPVDVASFKVAARAAEAGFPTSLAILLAVALLTVALAAFGAFGRWK